ncbi:hypothetical protein AA309_13240 [Microvirga vignae]|uniref:Uncharacterized protein n=1 Tax=Microvirga vignae TaxID=1225564 RepID=A0A0H1RJ53_9HYPH|nr:hypothetical protein AA309_13240 [Microvirga vignae]
MSERDLFGTVRQVHNWGWIGTNGQEKVKISAGELEAGRKPGRRSSLVLARVPGSVRLNCALSKSLCDARNGKAHIPMQF